MGDVIKPLSDQELQDWERWAGREIQWKSQDVQRLLTSVSSLRRAIELLNEAIVVVQHGSPLYDAVIDMRREVMRKPLGLDYTQAQLATEAPYVHLALLVNGEVKACLYLLSEGEAEGSVRMRQVAVSPESQGKGLGRKLGEAAERIAAQMGAREMVLDARQNAIPFYLKLGYEIYGEPYEQIGIPHRSMRKRLK